VPGTGPGQLLRSSSQGDAADSSNAIGAHRTGKIQSHHGNVKCLDRAFDGVGNPSADEIEAIRNLKLVVGTFFRHNLGS
jgi:hypothetical protein